MKLRRQIPTIGDYFNNYVVRIIGVGSVIVGLILLIYSAKYWFSHSELETQQATILTLASSMLLTGITFVYVGVTALLLVETRMQRIQNQAPMLLIHSDINISPQSRATFEIKNCGTANATDVTILLWEIIQTDSKWDVQPWVYVASNLIVQNGSLVTPVVAKYQKKEISQYWKRHLKEGALFLKIHDRRPHDILVTLIYHSPTRMKWYDCYCHQKSDVALAPSTSPAEFPPKAGA